MILITGGSRGIGRAIGERLQNIGHEILGVSRTRSHAQFETFEADVSDAESLRKISLKIRGAKRPVNALINAAGIASMNLALMTPPKTAESLVRTNLLGTINACQVFGPLLARSNGSSIINFSTIAVELALEGEAVYAATKAGIEAYTRTFARETSGLGVRANCIAPGPIATDLIRGISKAQRDSIIGRQAIQRQFTVEDICDLVELLLDPRANSLTGQVFHVGGI